MDNIVVSDMEIFDTSRNPPSVAQFPLKIDVTPLLSPQLPSTSPPHIPPPLSPPPLPEPLTLISPSPSPSDSVSYKEDDIVVEFRQKKWKEYLEGTKLKYVPFCQWKLKMIFGDSILPYHPLLRK